MDEEQRKLIERLEAHIDKIKLIQKQLKAAIEKSNGKKKPADEDKKRPKP